MLWRVYIEINCGHERVQEICNMLNTHRCVMSAKPVVEEGERTREGSPVNIPSPHVIACNALVLHQSEEDDLLRHIEKIREPTESIVEYDSEKRKVLTKHLLLTAGITSIILFGVVIGHEALLVGQDRPLSIRY